MNWKAMVEVIQKAVDMTNEGLAEDGVYEFWSMTFVEEFTETEKSFLVFCNFETDDNQEVSGQKWYTIKDIPAFYEKMIAEAPDGNIMVGTIL